MGTFAIQKTSRVMVIALFMILLRGGPLYAAKASIEDIIVTSNKSHLLLYFTVKDCFSEDIKKAIQNGIKTTFNFYVILHEVRDLLWNREIASLTFTHHIQYDSLKKLYNVELSGRDTPLSFKDMDSAGKAMSEIVGAEVAPLERLERGKRYKIAMKAELDRITLPFYLHYVLFFVSFWDYETDWYSVEFKY